MKKILIYILALTAMSVTASVTIENSLTPKDREPIKFDLEMTIGVEDGDTHEVFGSSIFFVITQNHDICVLDPSGFRVILFDAKGKVLKSFGQKGQGPGEFQAPSEIAIDSQGQLYVFDAMTKKIAVFSKDGEWIENRDLPQGVVAVMNPYLLDSGRFIFTSVKLDQEFQQAYVLGTMDKTIESFRPIISLPSPKMDWSKMGEPSFGAKFLKGHFDAIASGFPTATPLGDGFIAFNSSKYEGVAYDNEHTQKWMMTKEHKPMPYSKEAKYALCEAIYDGIRSSGTIGNVVNEASFNSAFRDADLPEFILPLTSLFPWDKGFGVLTNYKSSTKKGTVQLFDQEGRFIREGVFQGPAGIRVMKDGWLYASGVDEDYVTKIYKYKVNGL